MDDQTQEAAGDAGAVEVATTLPAPAERVWEALNTSAGTQALLGSGARLGGKGEPWRSDDGPHGVLRSYHPLEQLRVSWHERPDSPATLVDLRLRPQGEVTLLELRHEHLPPGADTEGLRRHWEASLDRLSAATAGAGATAGG